MGTDGGVLRRGTVGLSTVVGTSWPIQEAQHELGGLTDHRGYPRSGIHLLGTKGHHSFTYFFQMSHKMFLAGSRLTESSGISRRKCGSNSAAVRFGTQGSQTGRAAGRLDPVAKPNSCPSWLQRNLNMLGWVPNSGASHWGMCWPLGEASEPHGTGTPFQGLLSGYLTEYGGCGVRTPPRPGWESQAVPWEDRKAWVQWARKSLDAGFVLPSPKRESHPWGWAFGNGTPAYT